MIIKTTAFQVGDNHYGTLEEAKQASMLQLFSEEDPATGSGSINAPNWSASEICSFIIDNSEKIIDILTTTEKSRPKARKVNGAVRTRKSKRHNAEQFTLPITTTEAKA